MPEKTFEELTRAECLGMLQLGSQHLGRLAYVDYVGVVPLIVPVNYLMDDDTVVFRTDPGSKLAAAVRGAPVAFETDGVDEQHRTGWSVVVRGHAVEVTDEAELSGLREAPLAPWAPGGKAHYVRVGPGADHRQADQHRRAAVALAGLAPHAPYAVRAGKLAHPATGRAGS